MPTILRDYTPETADLVASLIAAGFVIRKLDDGGDETIPFLDQRQAVATLTSVDDANLYVTAPDGRKLTLRLIFGNSPGELVADWSAHERLDDVLSEVANRWDGRDQPTRVSP